MMAADRIADLEIDICPISGKTTWIFLRLRLTSGVTGLGEATLYGLEAGVQQKTLALAGSLRGLDIRAAIALCEDRMLRASDGVTQTVLSGLGQALLDARARSLGVAAQELLGGRRRAALPVYANINRGTQDRSPEGWAARADAAVAEGFRALKMAPFDGVTDTSLSAPGVASRIDHGLACIAAVRDAVGPGVAINIDCHARFDDATARHVLREIGRHAPHWVEMPVAERPDRLGSARRLRGLANDLGFRLAGAELVFGLGAVRHMIEAGAYDVYMPDLRHCGGVFEALRIAGLVHSAGLEFSLHNPAGPLLDRISLAVASVAPAVVMIEHQFREHPLHETLLTPAPVAPAAGMVDAPDGPGWGAGFKMAVLDGARGPLPDPVDHEGLPGAGPSS